MIWLHGTSAENAASILKGVFYKGTWFTACLEQALTHGNHVFEVEIGEHLLEKNTVCGGVWVTTDIERCFIVSYRVFTVDTKFDVDSDESWIRHRRG